MPDLKYLKEVWKILWIGTDQNLAFKIERQEEFSAI